MDIPQDVEHIFQYFETYQQPNDAVFSDREPKALREVFLLPNSYHNWVETRFKAPTLKTEDDVYNLHKFRQTLKTQLWQHFDTVMEYTLNELLHDYRGQNLVISFNDGKRQMTYGIGSDNTFKLPFRTLIHRKGELSDCCAVFVQNNESEIIKIKDLAYDDVSKFASEPCQ